MNGPLTGVGESSGLKTSPVITSTHNSYHHFQETLLLSLFLIFFPDVQAERGTFFPGRSGTLSAPVPAPALDRRGSSTPFLLRLKKPSFFVLVVAGKAVAVLPTRLAWRLWPLFGLRMLTRWTSGLRMVARRASGLRMWALRSSALRMLERRLSALRMLGRRTSGVRALPRGTSGAGAGEEGAGGCQAVTGCGTALIGSRIR